MVKTGIPVPDYIPEGSKPLVICVPDDPFFYGVVAGALKVALFRYYWQGTDEQIDAVTARMSQMYYEYQEQNGCMEIICDIVADCLTEGYENLINSLAGAIQNNQTLINAISTAVTNAGSGIPGDPLEPEQSQRDNLPENVRDEEGDCILDNLWGAMLYTVQSGNRVITDFFEVLEVASNTLESMEIVSKAIPAAGDYISAAAGFADQIGEVIAEGYAGAYTEAYEQSLACDLFCVARTNCELSIDAIIDVINARLSAPMDLADFGEIMTGIASGEWVGDEIADVAFLTYFAALKFGQQFSDTIGIRPLSVIMSLGADQLASDNWEVLCDCPECGIGYTVDTGTETPPDIVSASTELVTTLVDPMLDAYARRIVLTFAVPVSSIAFGWNTEGAGDNMFAKLGDDDYVTLPSPSGSMTLEGTPSTMFVVDLGYSLSPTAYDSNPARISITDACV